MSVADFVHSKPIVTIKRDLAVNDTFKTLFQAGVLSAPVIEKDGKVIGVLDMDDIVFFALSICKTSQELGKYFGGLSDEQQLEFVELDAIKLMTEEDMTALSEQGVTIDSAGFITNFSQRNQLTTIAPSASLDELTEVLRKHHRVVVLEGDKLVGYITQSDLVKFLSEQGKFSEKTLQDIDIGSTSITTITESQKVLEAFRDMALKRCSACAVVDTDGKLVSNISSLDIRGVSDTGDLMDRLYWKYSDYLASLEKELGIAPRGTYTTTLDKPLDQVVKDMIAHKRHHVYLVDEAGKPVRVISLGDVLRFLRN